MKKHWDKWIAQLIIQSGLLSVLERLEAERKNVVRILAYHRIGYPEAGIGNLSPPNLNATPDQFAEQMHYLVKHYNVLSIEDLLAFLSGKQPLPPRSAMVTFDDGYRDFLVYAWPVLQRLQIPVALFVATDYLSEEGRLYWWDQIYQAFSQTDRQKLCLPEVGTWTLRTSGQRAKAYTEIKGYIKEINHYQAMDLVKEILERLDVSPKPNGTLLNWHEVRQMSTDGLYVGSHTRSHPLLSRITLDAARQEIVGSQEDLNRKLGKTWPVFVYPSGHPDDLRPELPAILREEGFQIAMTMFEGHNVMGRAHPLLLKRVGMAPHLSLEEFRITLTEVYNIYGALQRFRSNRWGP